jgi:hypothetical protein
MLAALASLGEAMSIEFSKVQPKEPISGLGAFSADMSGSKRKSENSV